MVVFGDVGSRTTRHGGSYLRVCGCGIRLRLRWEEKLYRKKPHPTPTIATMCQGYPQMNPGKSVSAG